MDLRLKAPLLGAVLIGAAGIGAHMGETAIAHINPLYFQGAAGHPRDRGAAVDPTALPAPGPRFADHYGWAQGAAARLADCGDCAALAARDQYAVLPAYHVTIAHAEPLPQRMAVRAEPEPEPEPEPDFVVETAPEIERYAYYPIEEKPAGKPAAYASAEE
jgi:hypothetical protein